MTYIVWLQIFIQILSWKSSMRNYTGCTAWKTILVMARIKCVIKVTKILFCLYKDRYQPLLTTKNKRLIFWCEPVAYSIFSQSKTNIDPEIMLHICIHILLLPNLFSYLINWHILNFKELQNNCSQCKRWFSESYYLLT